MQAANALALTGANQAVLVAPGYYAGVTVRETAGAVAVVRIWDNASAASGTILATVSLAANGSFSEFVPGGIRAVNGIYVEKVSGTIEGSVRYA